MRKTHILNMLKDSPNDSFLHFALAKEHEKEDDFEAAVEEYEWIVENDPAYVGVYYHLAHAAIEIEKEDRYIEKVFSQGIQTADKQSDQHAKAELQNAKMNWEIS